MKKFILVCGFIILSMFTAGCTKEKVPTIQFATWGSQSEIEILKPIVENYNKTHNIKVEIMHVPQNYFQKLHLLFASNLAPDIIFINNFYLPVYQNADLFEDMTPYINKKDYYENALLTLSKNGKLYAIPRDVSSMVIFYNKDYFAKNKIIADDNWMIDDFYKIAENSKKNQEFGFCTEQTAVYWENFVSVDNKPLFIGDKETITEKNSIEAIQKLADNISIKKLSPKNEQLKITPCLQLFLQEKTPMIISGRWSVPKLESSSTFEYGVLPFPKGKSDYYIPLNASGWAVYKNSKNKKEAIDFVKYISSDENITKFAKSGLIIPAKKNIAISKVVENNKIFTAVIDKSTPNIVPNDYKIKIDRLEQDMISIFSGYKSAKEIFSK